MKNLLQAMAFMLFVLLSFSSFADVNSETAIDAQLSLADSLKSSDPAQFATILERLEQARASLNRNQSDKLTFLTAYRLAYTGQAAGAIELGEQLADEGVTLAMKLRAAIFITNVAGVNQNWELGLKYLTKSIAMLDDVTDKQQNILVYTIAAMFYNQLGQYEMAYEYAQKLQGFNLSGRNACAASQALIHSELKLDRMSPEDPLIDETIRHCESSNEMLWAGFLRSLVATQYLDKGNNQQALTLLLDNLPDIEKTRYPRVMVEAYSSLARAYFNLGSLNNVKKYALKSVDTGKGIDTTQSVVLAYELLYKVAKEQQDTESALKYLEAYAELNQTYLNDVTAKTTAVQLAKHQAAEQHNQIALLNKQNELLKANQQLDGEMTKNLKLLSVLSVSASLLIGFFGLRSWRTQKHFKALSEYDSLTRVYNRSHFTELADEAIQLGEDSKESISCIVLDLDNFKRVNEAHGYAAGDWALKRVAQVVSGTIRSNDIFTRLNGEEFAILLPGCDVKNAAKVAEKCRLAIKTINTGESGYDFSLSASFGVTDSYLSGYELDKLLSDADGAAHASNDKGGNKITLYQAPSSAD